MKINARIIKFRGTRYWAKSVWDNLNLIDDRAAKKVVNLKKIRTDPKILVTLFRLDLATNWRKMYYNWWIVWRNEN